MAYGTFTLQGQHFLLDGVTAEVGSVSVHANATIRDSDGQVVLSGKQPKTLDGTGSWSMTLPADDPTLNPSSGISYTITYHLADSTLATQRFPAQPIGSPPLDVANLVTDVIGAPVVSIVGPRGAGGDPAALAVSPLLDPAETLVGTNPWPVGVIAGVLWGAKADGTLHKSLDSGVTWTLVVDVTAATSTIQRLWQLGDGEVLVHTFGQLLRSSGWTANPVTATFTQTLTTAPRVTFFASWSVHAAGSKVIATEYDVYANQPWRCWVSTDNGATFTLRLDLETVRDAGQLAHTHWHAVAVDTFRDVLWATNGDQDDTNQLWVSDDDGATWAALAAPLAKKRITAILPMADGILLGSDDGSNVGPPGAWRVNPDNFEDIQVLHVIDTGSVGASQIGTSVHTAPDGTGYMCFEGFADQGAPSVILASTSGRTVSEVWRDPTPDATEDDERKIYAIYGPDTAGKMHARIFSTLHTGWHLTGGAGRPGSAANPPSVLAGVADVLGGLAISSSSEAGPQSVAVGANAEAGTFADSDSHHAVAIGYGAKASTTAVSPFNTAVGGIAQANGSLAAALGYDARATAESSLALGGFSRASGLGSVALGGSAEATNTGALAIGLDSTASGFDSTAVGHGAVANVAEDVAIGAFANTNWRGFAGGVRASTAAGYNGVALGYETATSAGDQVAGGARHWESSVVADPGVAPAGKGRWYFRTNAGKVQFCAQFPSGAVVVIATEP